MTKEVFKNKLDEELKGLSISEIKKFIIELMNELSPNYYEFILCKIKHFKNETYEIDNESLNEYNSIIDEFKKIKDGNICFKSYTIETGTYSYYDADVEYVYYPSNELQNILSNTYELIKKLILYKEYSKIITLFELIINTDYICEEVGNPEYDDTDEVYDSYEVDFSLVKDDLGIDLNKSCLYAIYSIIMCNASDRFEKIYKYTKHCYNLNIKDVENIGIEKINNFDKFYTEWLKYLEKKV